ncbi:MAG TPA: magnesium/cobalt transporter CorA [Micavibrio sp.]
MSRGKKSKNRRIGAPSRRRHHDSPGTVPGTIYVPEGASTPVIQVISYNEHELQESTITAASEIPPLLKDGAITWIDVDGLGSVQLLQELGDMFGLHPLALEDVSNLHHRAKIEEYDDHLFVITHMMKMSDGTLDREQLSLFIGKNFILTIQERGHDGDVLNPVRERLRRSQGRLIRKAGADYLGYAILDTIIDGYFPVTEHFGDWISTLEDRVIENPSRIIIGETHDIKRQLQLLRHSIWPMREVVMSISNDSHHITPETRLYLRDLRDHVINVMDLLEIDRERATGLIDIYLTSVNNQMNETMRVLTIIATTFIPLSFITGIYGMNFDRDASPWNMPELGWFYGYPFALSLMAAVALCLIIFFIRRGWLRGDQDK